MASVNLVPAIKMLETKFPDYHFLLNSFDSSIE